MNSIIRLARPLLAPRISPPRPTDIHMPLTSPSDIDIYFPPQQLLHALPHSAITSNSSCYLTRIRRPRAHRGSVFASRPAGPAAALRTPKYHEWPHEAGAEAETWVAQEDEE
ncbi:hypothetical protein TrVGV298_000366 [Trichoderma virens]|nr:hypothetical protein TrVGV298_000366 [Trichoderma virens]